MTSDREPTTPVAALGDIELHEFRRVGHAIIDRIAAYLNDVERWPVLAQTRPGELSDALPAEPPDSAEPFDRILDDYDRLVPPATTHWNHPCFFAYFATSGSAPGILAEALAAALNVNAMLWRTGPAETELEFRTMDWLRRMLGLPDGFDGVINDTASSSTMYALAAAREAQHDLAIRQHGMAGRTDLPPLRIYCSAEAHSSVDKAAITLGIGLDGVRRIATDARFAMDADALSAAIAEDSAAGARAIAVVATVGTTSTTAIDPVARIAEICAHHGAWLHVDAAYGGAAAIVPELRTVLDGCDRADSIVVNPHKWLFVPLDCSALFCRRPAALQAAFSLTPDYLMTTESAARNLMDYGLALGRRFRALKLWFVLRRFGAAGLADRIREHIRLARLFASWVDADPSFERLSDVPFSVVVFRCRPAGVAEAELDALNERLLERVNEGGKIYLSHTRVSGQYAIRLAIGNIRTAESHVALAWRMLKRQAALAMELPEAEPGL